MERHACELLPHAAFRARADALGAWIPPDALVRYRPRQRAAPGFPFSRFAPGDERWWVPASPVQEGPRSAVLSDFACFPGAFPPGDRARLVTHATSSGCASGRTRAEAALRATLELVERDAFMRHWFAQRPGRSLRERSLPASCAARLHWLRARGCAAGLQCLTLGASPVLLAWARDAHRCFTCVGMAAALDPEAAAVAALQEMETFALARLQGVPGAPIAPEQVRSPADHGALYATREWFDRADALLQDQEPPLAWRELEAPCADAPAAWYARLRQRGHLVHTVDLSLPEAENFLDGAPLYTVRAVAPGLVPLAFGPHQAFGMVRAIAPGARFPHPFT